MINTVVVDLIETTTGNIRRVNPSGIEDIRQAEKPLVGLSDEVKDRHLQLKQFLYRNLYRHERVLLMSDNAREIVERLFNRYMDDPSCLPPEVVLHLREGKDVPEAVQARRIADYIAGMTDRFAISEAERFG
jgi:dGTPase